jgi:hypothetical protein
MNKKFKNHPFSHVDDNNLSINCSSFYSLFKRKNVLILLLFLGVLVTSKAKSVQQVPASKLKVVVANAPKSSQNKSKAKTVKTKVKKAKAVRKDTLPEIDPANTNSPLFDKNQ